MNDMNNLSMTDLAAYGEDEPRCGECGRPIDWCTCYTADPRCTCATRACEVHELSITSKHREDDGE